MHAMSLMKKACIRKMMPCSVLTQNNILHNESLNYCPIKSLKLETVVIQKKMPKQGDDNLLKYLSK